MIFVLTITILSFLLIFFLNT